MPSIAKHQDYSVLRINKHINLSAEVINLIISEQWELLNASSLKTKMISGSVGEKKYSLPSLQNYVEGPVIQLTGPFEKNIGADFLLLMHPMNDVRKKDGGSFVNKIVDSGMHIHRGPRHLQIFIAEKALVTIPVLSVPELVNLRENIDYVIREKIFKYGKGKRLGFEVVLSPAQVINVSFDANVAHSFNAIFNPCVVFSHHPNETLEMATSKDNFNEISDGSEFLLPPQLLSNNDISEYQTILEMLSNGEIPNK